MARNVIPFVILAAMLAVALLVVVHELAAWDTAQTVPELPPGNPDIPPIEQLLLWEACCAGGRSAITAHLILRAQQRAAGRINKDI